MATAASVTTDLTTCPICLDVFDNQKSLPCVHTFCLKCLQRYFHNKSPGHEVHCPLCRKGFKIPSDGLSALPHNLFIQHLVNAKNDNYKSTGDVLCEACIEQAVDTEGQISSASVYCIDCSINLCETCCRPHRSKAIKDGPHEVRPLGAELEQELIQLRKSKCEKHPDEEVKLYCHDCTENICLICSAVQHKTHNCEEITEFAREVTKQINDDDEQVLKQAQHIREKIRDTDARMTEYRRMVDGTESEMKKAGDALNAFVNDEVARHQRAVSNLKSSDTNKAATTEQKYELELVARETFHTYLRELLDKGRPSDITRAARELRHRATELLEDDVTSVQYTQTELAFRPVDLTKLAEVNLTGQVTDGNGDPVVDAECSQSFLPIDILMKQREEKDKEVKELNQKIKKLEDELKEATKLLAVCVIAQGMTYLIGKLKDI